ncbi:MAG TPA: NADH-quinone oxidoreductase subunit NuoE [Actinomycetota bacterium]|nr:NADH-quinone oxidoreductase subunit NuoE [Actinomycetota bacterium]
MPVFDDDLRRRADELVARYPSSRSALLPLLYLAQSVEGYLSREGMREVGDILGLSTAEVEAVATYYTMYKHEPTGRWLLSICTNVSCAVLGGRRLYERAKELLGEDAEKVTEDGAITLEEVECLGACDAAPVLQVNYCNYDRVSEEQLTEMIERLRSDDPPEPARGPKPVDHARTSWILATMGDDRA